MTAVDTWTAIVTLTGSLHFVQLPAMILGPRYVPSLRWHEPVRSLPPLSARIVAAMVVGIVITVCGLGIVVVTHATEIVTTTLGRALSAFLAAFWAYRSGVQWLVHGPVWPRAGVARLTHLALGALFTAQTCAYLGVAAAGLWS